MAIILQSSVGGFDNSFMQKLPLVEQAMTEQGLAPSRFVISKDRSLFTNSRPFGSLLWDYTVFVDGEHFTVTKPNDLSFLDYFYSRCVAPDETTAEPQPGHDGLFTRLARWMSEPV